MRCVEFSVTSENVTDEGGEAVQAALRRAIEAALRNDAAAPVLTDFKNGKLRVNVKIGPIEAVFEEELEQTFEPFIESFRAEGAEAMADRLEEFARQMREAALRRTMPLEDGPG